MMKKEEFNSYMPVHWKSTSNGSTTVKRGTAIAVLEAGVVPSKVFPVLASIPNSSIKLGGGAHGVSSRDRLLVRVHKKTGEALVPLFYAPLLSVVEVGHTNG